MSSVYEDRNRGAKATVLVGQLHADATAAGALTPLHLVPTTQAGWNELAARAGTTPPSPRTQEIVRSTLERSTDATHDDPFDGL